MIKICREPVFCRTEQTSVSAANTSAVLQSYGPGKWRDTGDKAPAFPMFDGGWPDFECGMRASRATAGSDSWHLNIFGPIGGQDMWVLAYIRPGNRFIVLFPVTMNEMHAAKPTRLSLFYIPETFIKRQCCNYHFCQAKAKFFLLYSLLSWRRPYNWNLIIESSWVEKNYCRIGMQNEAFVCFETNIFRCINVVLFQFKIDANDDRYCLW